MSAKWLLVLLGACALGLTIGVSRHPPVAAQDPAASESLPVDLVICLDTSGSMSDLIDSARGRIWNIVTELAQAQPTPSLRVGLLTYGTPSVSSLEQGWVLRQADLTDDLDSFYAKMMALTTNGGDEFVGWVLSEAVESMSWSPDPRALRLIYVAGNESADQGAEERNFRYVAEKARGSDIVINPIYAGPREQGIRELWDQVATHGGGHFAVIDAREGTLQVATPYDRELLILNEELNGTYLPYGLKGAEGVANQIAQDANAGKLGALTCSSRIAAKGCSLYNNALWDLVDAARSDGFQLSELKSEELPESLRSLTLKERKAYIEGMGAVRESVRSRIQEIDAARQAYLRAERVTRSRGEISLDDAIIHSLRTQARGKGFTFPERPTETPTAVVSTSARETEPLPEQFRANVNALIAAMPAVRHHVGAYEARYEEFATVLMKHTGQSLTYGVGEESFTSREKAEERLTALLKEEIRVLRAIEEVEVGTSPFVYSRVLRKSPGAPSRNARFRIGGLEFPDKARAETASKMIDAAIAELERGRSPLAPPSPAFLMEKIRVTAEAAARVFVNTGC